jgi:hypothetical protein
MIHLVVNAAFVVVCLPFILPAAPSQFHALKNPLIAVFNIMSCSRATSISPMLFHTAGRADSAR